jgi:hypothetical protein
MSALSIRIRTVEEYAEDSARELAMAKLGLAAVRALREHDKRVAERMQAELRQRLSWWIAAAIVECGAIAGLLVWVGRL